MAVSRVSFEDISLARGEMPTTVTPKTSVSSGRPTKSYVDMISDEKLVKFFSKYKSLGYVSHLRDDESKTIKVICNDFEVIFNDFCTTVGPREDQPTQMYEDFKFSCGVAGTTPDAVVDSLLSTELFGNLPYYTEKKHQFDSNNLKSLKTGSFKDIVGPAVSARAMMIEQPLMTKMYGSDSLEDIANVMNSVRTLS